MSLRSTFCRLIALIVPFVVACAGARAQTCDIRVVHVAPGAPNVDVFFNDITTAVVADLAYGYTTAVAKIPIGTGTLNFKVAPAGAGIGAAVINQNATVASAVEYTGIVYMAAGTPKMKVLERLRSKVPGANKALLRIFNASSFSPAATFDFYLDSLAGTPAFSGVAAEAATNYLELKAEPKTLYITNAGTKTSVAQLIVPLVASGRVTLIVTGTSKTDITVHALNGENQDGYQLPTLEGVQGGILPSVRAVHAWWQPKIQGSGVQPLDVYLNDNAQPSSANLRYRNATEKYGPLTGDSAVIRFAPVSEGPGSAIFTQTIHLRRDSDYVAILTKSKEGAAAALTLSAPNSVPGNAADSLFVRAAYVTDFHPNVVVRIVTSAGDTVRFPPVQFLTASDWFTIPRGHFTVQAFAYADTVPFYTKENDGNFATTYLTVLVLGSETTFELDILNEALPIRQEFDPSSAVPAGPVAGQSGLAMRAVPNPASMETSIGFRLASPAQVTLTLHDPLGRTVSTVFDGRMQAGDRSATLNTAGLAAGTYLYHLRTDTGEQGTGQLVVVH